MSLEASPEEVDVSLVPEVAADVSEVPLVSPVLLVSLVSLVSLVLLVSLDAEELVEDDVVFDVVPVAFFLP